MRASLLLLPLLIACGGRSPTEAPGPGVERIERVSPTPPLPPVTETVAFTCVTTKHRAEVVRSGATTLYRGYGADVPPDAAPETEVVGGTPSSDDSGECGVDAWEFTRGEIVYRVERGGCEDPGRPVRGPWFGRLVVRDGDREISNRVCGPHGRKALTNGETLVWRPGVMQVLGESSRDVFRARTDREGGSYYEESHVPRSVVGDLVSWDLTWYGEGGEHPTYGTRRKVMDVTNRARRVDLMDLVDVTALRDAMVEHPMLQPLLPVPPPADAEGVIAALDGGCGMDLSKAMTRSFAFGPIEGEFVRVQLGITHGCEAARGTFTELDLMLPVPPPLKADLDAAMEAGTLRAESATVASDPTP